jgi:hypothetical protein
VLTIISILLIILLVIFFGIRFFNNSADICTTNDQCVAYSLSCCPDNFNDTAFNKGYLASLNFEKKISCWTLNPACPEPENSTFNLVNKAYCTQQRTCAIHPDCDAVCDSLAQHLDDPRYEEYFAASIDFGCSC